MDTPGERKYSAILGVVNQFRDRESIVADFRELQRRRSGGQFTAAGDILLVRLQAEATRLSIRLVARVDYPFG